MPGKKIYLAMSKAFLVLPITILPLRISNKQLFKNQETI